jgi:hypothetical protein
VFGWIPVNDQLLLLQSEVVTECQYKPSLFGEHICESEFRIVTRFVAYLIPKRDAQITVEQFWVFRGCKFEESQVVGYPECHLMDQAPDQLEAYQEQSLG